MIKKAMLSKRDKRIYQVIFIVFILLCTLIGYSCFRYYVHLQNTVKTESQGYMEEISKQMGTNVNKNIDDKFAMLGTMSTVLKNLNISSYDQFEKAMVEQQKLWNYQKLFLIDQNGIAYDEKGTPVVLNKDTYLQDVIVHDLPSLSSSQVIDGKESIVFAIPIDNVKVNNTTMAALAASFDLSTFDKILAMTAFDGKGYAHIIGSDGSIVVRSSSENALPTGYNVLNSLSRGEFIGDNNIDNIKNDIANGQSGQAEFILDDNREYMTYVPLGDYKWNLLSFVPVEVVNSKSAMLLNITLLMCAFITVIFAALLGILILTFYRNKKKLEQIAYVDSVTGGHTIDKFYDLAKEHLSTPEPTQYALIYTNIKKFKVLNEQFGRKACDLILSGIDHGINLDLDSDECIGHWFADNFCILVKYENEAALASRFERWHKNEVAYVESKEASWLPLVLEFGVYVIANRTLPFPQMIDRAKLSLNETVHTVYGNIRYAIYDEKLRRLLFREKQLEDRMEAALKDKEFQLYLQPKYHTQTEKIGGAEALVRWLSPSEGMIYPDEFIPLFEKNGFIIQLDFYMFEATCQIISKWIAQGLTPVRISVNCSRLHLKNTDFIETYSRIADQYAVPHELIEVELTENIVFEDVTSLTAIIKAIQAAGFWCSMDDFGSGYSSLNLIQDIPVDTLKLDKIFFRNTRDLCRSESVIGSVITMSKALCMETVAEGVEQRIQVDMLKRLKCDYIQGYFFAKPMPVNEFEHLAFE